MGVEHVDRRRGFEGGRVVIHGWKTSLPLTPVDAVLALERYCDEFLYTHVDKEGLMQGTDMAAIRAVRDATARRVTAAGGITTRDEIDALERHAGRRRGRDGDLHGKPGPGLIEGRRPAGPMARRACRPGDLF